MTTNNNGNKIVFHITNIRKAHERHLQKKNLRS
jgi:hypothetical protein